MLFKGILASFLNRAPQATSRQNHTEPSHLHSPFSKSVFQSKLMLPKTDPLRKPQRPWNTIRTDLKNNLSYIEV